LNRIGRRTIIRMLLIAALARGIAGDKGSPVPGRDVRRADDVRSDLCYAGDQPPQTPVEFDPKRKNPEKTQTEEG